MQKAHSINAVLIGEDPKKFNNWMFIEPQKDWEVTKFSDKTIKIRAYIPSDEKSLLYKSVDKISFTTNNSGEITELYVSDPHFIVDKPSVSTLPPVNYTHLWNPMIINEGNGLLLYNKSRDDMSKITDIHISDMPFDPGAETVALVNDPVFGSRLFDYCKGPDGKIHLFWANFSFVNMNANGLYYEQWTGTYWDNVEIILPQETITEYEIAVQVREWYGVRSRIKYFFDVTAIGNRILLAWSNSNTSPPDNTLKVKEYDNGWQPEVVLETGNVVGMRMATDSSDNVHLVYWANNDYDVYNGNIYHKIYDGTSWSSSNLIDENNNACDVHLEAGNNNDLYLIWERDTGSQVIPAWCVFANNVWRSCAELSVRQNADAWYPVISPLANGDIAMSWFSCSSDLATIEFDQAQSAPPPR